MYNKLFTKILDSSIWMEPSATRIVWLTFIAAMDEQGFVQFASIHNVAHRAIVTLEEAREAVRCLESPDPNSADPDFEGRRIERITGGWMVLNSHKYKIIATREHQKELIRLRVKKHRDLSKCNAHVTLRNDLVTPSDTDTEKDNNPLTPLNGDKSPCSGKFSVKIEENAVNGPKNDSKVESATTTLPDPSKQRLPLKAKEIGITTNKTEDEKSQDQWNNDDQRLIADMCCEIFRRRKASKFLDKERKLIKSIASTDLYRSDLEKLKWYYLQSGCKYLRKDILTFLNNFQGEIDRAKNYKK